MNLDHNFARVWKFSEDQKKKMQMEHFFSPNSGEVKKKKKKRSLSKIEHFFFPNSGEDQIKNKNKQKKGLRQKQNTFSSQIQVKTKQKKRSSSKIEHFFSPNFRSDVNPLKILGEMQMWTILKLLGDISPPSSPGFGTPEPKPCTSRNNYE